MRLRLTTRAYNDLATISSFLEERDPRAAASLFAVFDGVFEELHKMPQRGRQTDIPNVRCVVVPRLPYRIFYRATPETIEILTVFHTARDPRDTDLL